MGKWEAFSLGAGVCADDYLAPSLSVHSLRKEREGQAAEERASTTNLWVRVTAGPAVRICVRKPRVRSNGSFGGILIQSLQRVALM